MRLSLFLQLLAAFVFAAGNVFIPTVHAFKAPSQVSPADVDARKIPAAAALSPARIAAISELRARVPGLKIDFDELRDTPKWIACPNGFLSGPGGEAGGISPQSARAFPANDPHRPIKTFLNEHSALFGHGAEVLDSARVKRDYTTAHNALRSVVWEQQLDQITVYEAVLIAHVTQRGELVNVSSQFLPNLQQAADTGTPNRLALEGAPAISAWEAV